MPSKTTLIKFEIHAEHDALHGSIMFDATELSFVLGWEGRAMAKVKKKTCEKRRLPVGVWASVFGREQWREVLSWQDVNEPAVKEAADEWARVEAEDPVRRAAGSRVARPISRTGTGCRFGRTRLSSSRRPLFTCAQSERLEHSVGRQSRPSSSSALLPENTLLTSPTVPFPMATLALLILAFISAFAAATKIGGDGDISFDMELIKHQPCPYQPGLFCLNIWSLSSTCFHRVQTKSEINLNVIRTKKAKNSFPRDGQ
jgi:hypothetical protein